MGRVAGAALIGYLAGTVPSADIAARVATRGEIDIRRVGTGNPGAANVVQSLGTSWGVGVWAADVVKAAAGCVAGRRVAGDVGAHVAGVGSVVGHCYPVWTGFRGGKGVSCSVGQVAATFPAYFPIDLSVAVATWTLPWWRARAEAATFTAAGAWIASAVVWWRRRWPNHWGPEPTVALPLAAAASVAVIVRRFRETAGVQADQAV